MDSANRSLTSKFDFCLSLLKWAKTKKSGRAGCSSTSESSWRKKVFTKILRTRIEIKNKPKKAAYKQNVAGKLFRRSGHVSSQLDRMTFQNSGLLILVPICFWTRALMSPPQWEAGHQLGLLYSGHQVSRRSRWISKQQIMSCQSTNYSISARNCQESASSWKQQLCKHFSKIGRNMRVLRIWMLWNWPNGFIKANSCRTRWSMIWQNRKLRTTIIKTSQFLWGEKEVEEEYWNRRKN